MCSGLRRGVVAAMPHDKKLAELFLEVSKLKKKRKEIEKKQVARLKKKFIKEASSLGRVRPIVLSSGTGKDYNSGNGNKKHREDFTKYVKTSRPGNMPGPGRTVRLFFLFRGTRRALLKAGHVGADSARYSSACSWSEV